MEEKIGEAFILFQQWEKQSGNREGALLFYTDGSGQIISHDARVYNDRGYTVSWQSPEEAIHVLNQIKGLSQTATIAYCRGHKLDISENGL